jgi:predicted AAA+ superfamily ATPase
VTEKEILTGGLPPFLRNRSSRLVKSPKLFFTDSGLAAHLAGITTLEPGRDDLLRGALFETYVVQNLAALLEAQLPDAQLAFWHEQGRHEVDFVLEVGRKVFGIESKRPPAGAKAISPACGHFWNGHPPAPPLCWLTTARKP